MHADLSKLIPHCEAAQPLLRLSRKYGIRVVATPETLQLLRESQDPKLMSVAANMLSTDALFTAGAFGVTLSQPKNRVGKVAKYTAGKAYA